MACDKCVNCQCNVVPKNPFERFYSRVLNILNLDIRTMSEADKVRVTQIMNAVADYNYEK